MNKYEAMFIIKPELSEEERKAVFNQIGEAITKNNGKVLNALVWAEKRKLTFKIKRHQEGLYYLMDFSLLPKVLKELNQAYRLNENILRSLITKTEK